MSIFNFPSSIKIGNGLERQGHRFEPTQARSCFEIEPSTKPAKNADQVEFLG